MARIGFEVGEWKNKPFSEFTNEELVEYYYKLRLVSKSGKVNGDSSSADLYVVGLQQEIISRMNRTSGNIKNIDIEDFRSTIEAWRSDKGGKIEIDESCVEDFVKNIIGDIERMHISPRDMKLRDILKYIKVHQKVMLKSADHGDSFYPSYYDIMSYLDYYVIDFYCEKETIIIETKFSIYLKRSEGVGCREV